MHNKIVQILLIVILSAVLLGCTGGNATSSATPTALPTSTRTVETVTPVPTPTLTPIPTLSPDDASARVLGLMQTNGGCQLPCWWGITPGRITVQEATEFLDPFADHLTVSELGVGALVRLREKAYKTSISDLVSWLPLM